MPEAHIGHKDLAIGVELNDTNGCVAETLHDGCNQDDEQTQQGMLDKMNLLD